MWNELVSSVLTELFFDFVEQSEIVFCQLLELSEAGGFPTR